MSFEVVDSSIVTEKLPPLSTDGSAHNTETDVFVSSAFMPQRVLAKLENRRGVGVLIYLDSILSYFK